MKNRRQTQNPQPLNEFERTLEMDDETRIANAYFALNGLIELCNAAFQSEVNPEHFGQLLQYIQNDLGAVAVGTRGGKPEFIGGAHLGT